MPVNIYRTKAVGTKLKVKWGSRAMWSRRSFQPPHPSASRVSHCWSLERCIMWCVCVRACVCTGELKLPMKTMLPSSGGSAVQLCENQDRSVWNTIQALPAWLLRVWDLSANKLLRIHYCAHLDTSRDVDSRQAQDRLSVQRFKWQWTEL